jgi:hypothetical protein
VDLLGLCVEGGSLLVLIIEATHPLHTHSRSALYIYKVFQLLLASDHKDAAPLSDICLSGT